MESWRKQIQEKFDKDGYITVESSHVLNSMDVWGAMEEIDRIEDNRNEADEWRHIDKLREERAKRFSEVGSQ